MTSNMKSQTGGTVPLGLVVLHGKIPKQKLNVKSSIEAELVGVSDYFLYNIWLLLFMSSQWYGIKKACCIKTTRALFSC